MSKETCEFIAAQAVELAALRQEAEGLRIFKKSALEQLGELAKQLQGEPEVRPHSNVVDLAIEILTRQRRQLAEHVQAWGQAQDRIQDLEKQLASLPAAPPNGPMKPEKIGRV